MLSANLSYHNDGENLNKVCNWMRPARAVSLPSDTQYTSSSRLCHKMSQNQHNCDTIKITFAGRCDKFALSLLPMCHHFHVTSITNTYDAWYIMMKKIKIKFAGIYSCSSWHTFWKYLAITIWGVTQSKSDLLADATALSLITVSLQYTDTLFTFLEKCLSPILLYSYRTPIHRYSTYIPWDMSVMSQFHCRRSDIHFRLANISSVRDFTNKSNFFFASI